MRQNKAQVIKVLTDKLNINMELIISLKKNCTNCVHLEWGFGDINDPEGLMCNQRNYYQGGGDSSQKERFHQKQLENKAYLEKPKKCCTLKSNPEKV